MAESDLPPSERGAISTLIDKIERLTEVLQRAPAPMVAGASAVNWWDVVPELRQLLHGQGYTERFEMRQSGNRMWIDAQPEQDRLSLTIAGNDGRVYWRKVIFYGERREG